MLCMHVFINVFCLFVYHSFVWGYLHSASFSSVAKHFESLKALYKFHVIIIIIVAVANIDRER